MPDDYLRLPRHMSPNKVDRTRLTKLTDLPNIGKATVKDFHQLNIFGPDQLLGQCPFEMYQRLCKKTGQRHDPCVIDVFMSVTEFMAGKEALPWWKFTENRKQQLMQKAEQI